MTEEGKKILENFEFTSSYARNWAIAWRTNMTKLMSYLDVTELRENQLA